MSPFKVDQDSSKFVAASHVGHNSPCITTHIRSLYKWQNANGGRGRGKANADIRSFPYHNLAEEIQKVHDRRGYNSAQIMAPKIGIPFDHNIKQLHCLSSKCSVYLLWDLRP